VARCGVGPSLGWADAGQPEGHRQYQQPRDQHVGSLLEGPAFSVGQGVEQQSDPTADLADQGVAC
jgi:hypothetical protein